MNNTNEWNKIALDMMEIQGMTFFIKNCEGIYLHPEKNLHGIIIKGRTDDEIYAYETVEKIRKNEKLVREQVGKIVTIEDEFIFLNNSAIYQAINLKAFHTDNGLHIIGVSKDMTDYQLEIVKL